MSKPKVYLSPAYHKWNPCAISGCDETTHNNQYLDELEVYLKACKIDYKRGTRRVPKSSENGTTLMNKAIKESNAYKPDIHYVSHTNASNGTVRGYRPMIYLLNNPKGEKLAEIMIKYRKEIYDQKISLVRTSEWAELRETSAVAYYEEHVFHDNYDDAKWFHDNMRVIARQTCKAFCEYLGVSFVDPYEVKKESTELYRVRKKWTDVKSQLGAYKSLPNAKAQADKNPGYKVFDSKGKVVYSGSTSTVKKSLDELAREVLNGKWGNGAERKTKITNAYKAGEIAYDYKTIQKRVNELA